MWQFLGYRDWKAIPYASTTTIELSYDPLCIEIVLRLTDSLEHHSSQLHRCLGVRVSANGRGFDIDPREEGAATIGPHVESGGQGEDQAMGESEQGLKSDEQHSDEKQ